MGGIQSFVVNVKIICPNILLNKRVIVQVSKQTIISNMHLEISLNLKNFKTYIIYAKEFIHKQRAIKIRREIFSTNIFSNVKRIGVESSNFGNTSQFAK